MRKNDEFVVKIANIRLTKMFMAIFALTERSIIEQVGKDKKTGTMRGYNIKKSPIWVWRYKYERKGHVLILIVVGYNLL